jgi:hypothetical protein
MPDSTDMSFDVNKRLLMAAGANSRKLKKAYGWQAYDPGIRDEGGSSQRRSASILNHDGSARRRHPALLLAVMLGIAVLSWGLDYKLSPYRSGMAKLALPAANLLLQKERPAAGLMIVSFQDNGHPWPRVRHLRVSDTKPARPEGGPLEVEGGSQESPDSVTIRLQKAWQVNRGIPRAPPAVF